MEAQRRYVSGDMALERNAIIRRTAPYLALAAVAVWLFVETGSFADRAGPDQLGPAFWPRTLLAALILVCGAAAVRTALGIGPSAAERAQQAMEAAANDTTESPPAPRRVGLAIGIVVAYVGSLGLLGYPIATALLLAGLLLIGGYRRPWPVVLASVAGSALTFALFRAVVYVSLPLGRGPFLEATVAVMNAAGIR